MGNVIPGTGPHKAGVESAPNSEPFKRPAVKKTILGVEPATDAAPATDGKTALQNLVKVQEKLIADFGTELIKLATKEAVTTFLKVKKEKMLATVGGAPAPATLAAPGSATLAGAATLAPGPATLAPGPAALAGSAPATHAPVPVTPAGAAVTATTPAGPSHAKMFADFPKKVDDFIKAETYRVPDNIAGLLNKKPVDAAQIINLLCIKVAESIIEDKPAEVAGPAGVTGTGVAGASGAGAIVADPSVIGKGADPAGVTGKGADPSVTGKGADPASGAGTGADPASGAGTGAIKGGGRSRRRKCAHVCQQCTLLRKKSMTRKTMTRKPMTRKKPIHTQEANTHARSQ